MNTAIPAIGPIMLLVFPIALIQIGLMVWALIDIAKRQYVKGNNKIVWILVVVLINIIGPIVYFLIGRQDGPREDNSA
jgi:heme/copper-type cytochrome/quinol oxidase subunit 2